MRLAAAFVNSTPLDWEGNFRSCSLALGMARGQGAQVVCLPELCLSGYGCEDAFLSHGTTGRALQFLQKILAQTEGLIASLGLPLEFEGSLYNVAALCVDGELVALIPKQHLADDGIHYEPRWFKAWPAGRRERIKVFGKDLPLGDWIVKIAEASIGFEICHDAWVKDRPCAALKARGANLILCPSASHFSLGKYSLREKLVLEAAGHDLSYIYTNLMGNEAGRAIYDGGAMIADGSGMRARGLRFSYHDAGVVSADIDLKPTTPESGVIEIPYRSPRQSMASPQVQGGPLPYTPMSMNDEFTSAAALGLFDYLRKSKARGFTLSLSGGADSAATAALVYAMRTLATQELGEAGFSKRLGHTEPLLRCVYQATENSSSITREAARTVAQAVGASFAEFDIESLVRDVRKMVEKTLGRALSWEQDDLTLQNLQARVRSPGIWALANATGTLLLATNNRSEAAAGYATMDGDTSGGLAPLAGIGKHFLRAWLRDYEKILPDLHRVNMQEPTAELRPPAAGQTDERDLMPYEILDAIELLAVRDHLPPLKVFDQLSAEFSVHESKTLGQWIIRYFQLFSRSQWKRERLAPSFHLDDHNLDPRNWYRFPILSGNYDVELLELRGRLDL
jgi:NAD+ synthase (glutamine-hydrolysing)